MEFKVGDRVRIKTWEQMKKEFGENFDGEINCRPCFTEYMKHLCGRTASIDEIYGTDVVLTNWSDSSNTRRWCLSTDMIELVDTSKFTKSDLQEGDVVIDREGCKSVFFDNEFVGSTLSIYGLTNDLKDEDGNTDNDIVKVERPIKMETVFERKEPEVIEMTVEEISRALGHEVKVVK